MAILQNTTVSGSLVITGDLTARQFILSSSVTFYTESFSSGSTRFGDSMDDTMVVTGSLRLTGSIGINTTAPAAALDARIPGESAASGKVALIAATSNGANDIFRWFDGATQLGVIKNSGAVGIGTSSPTSPLHITAQSDSVGGDGIRLSNSAVNRLWNTRFGTNTDLSYNLDFYDGSSWSNKLKLTYTGMVGIGITPSTWDTTILALEIGNKGGFYAGFNSTATSVTYIGNNAYYNGGWKYANTSAYRPLLLDCGDGNYHFQNAAAGTAGNAITWTSLMRITSTGNVGIGITNPSYKLDVRSSGGNNNFVHSYTEITGNGQQCGFVANSLWSGSERGVTWAMFKHGSITNPATYYSLWSGTSTFQYMHMDDSGVLRLSLNSGDIGTANGTIVGTQTSDIRLKNVKESFNYGLSDILKINPIAFTFKNDTNNTDKLGFSAQEMINIIPESVYNTNQCIDGYDDTDDPMVKIPKSNNNVYGMDYTTLIPVLVKAIQELSAKVTALENK